MEQIRRSDLPPRTEEDQPVAPLTAAPLSQTQIIDEVLDQIDQVLEDSAEAFVQGFVQKGGQ
ncbi:MAG: ubiquitin-like protein Pup [Bifidobacteriaceae bacterium]|jgi:ubiquitin-like protein Pup|nr:ubiquitin-like protein Pup [Bifidobacteriaceae bacterium]